MPGYIGSGRTDHEVRQAVGKWRDSLVNLTGTNRLLNLKPSKTGMLLVTRPAPGEVLARVRRGKGYTFRAFQPDATPPPSPDHLDVDRTQEDLGKIARSLYRRSTQAYLDQGLSVLYLAFGRLSWTDVDRTAYKSPLLLVPVRLATTGPKMLPVLEPTEDDTIVNPALALKLEQLGITLPTAEGLDEIADDTALGAFLNKVRSAVSAHEDWLVTDHLIVSCFSFAKEAMYRDLLENEDAIAGHAAVKALALGGATATSAGGGDRFVFDEIPDSEIDEKAPPETTPVIPTPSPLGVSALSGRFGPCVLCVLFRPFSYCGRA